MEPLPNDWSEPIDLRPRYRLSRAAFFLAALTMGMYGLGALCRVMAIMGQSPVLRRILVSDWWEWLIDAPMTFGSLVASLLLVGLWKDRSWRTRASLLALLNTIDLGYWMVEHASVFGIPIPRAPFRVNGLSMVIIGTTGLVELGLLASLATEVSLHLDRPEIAPIARVARTAAGIGLTLWFILAINQLDWLGGFPPRFLRWRLETFLAFLGTLIATSVSAFLVTIACSHACAASAKVLVDIERERKENDPFRSRSEH